MTIRTISIIRLPTRIKIAAIEMERYFIDIFQFRPIFKITYFIGRNSRTLVPTEFLVLVPAKERRIFLDNRIRQIVCKSGNVTVEINSRISRKSMERNLVTVYRGVLKLTRKIRVFVFLHILPPNGIGLVQRKRHHTLFELVRRYMHNTVTVEFFLAVQYIGILDVKRSTISFIQETVFHAVAVFHCQHNMFANPLYNVRVFSITLSINLGLIIAVQYFCIRIFSVFQIRINHVYGKYCCTYPSMALHFKIRIDYSQVLYDRRGLGVGDQDANKAHILSIGILCHILEKARNRVTVSIERAREGV